jgi:hypothetical protein
VIFLLLVIIERRFASFPGLTGDHDASGVDRFVHGGKLAGAFGVEVICPELSGQRICG